MRVIILVVLCCAAVTAVPAEQNRIVGGAITTVNQYPTIAALLYSVFGVTPFNQACGGTILTTRAILTAGHCPYGDSVARWRIRVGSSYANSGGTIHSLLSIAIHPNYNSRTTDYDIAILRTVNSITYSTVVQPASIASSNYYLPDNAVVWAVGWGTTKSGGSPSEQLRHVQLWTVNQGTCRSRYDGLGRIVTDNMLCSGWLDVGGRDQCQGDSGGPLYHNNVIVGVCSWGAGCANAQYPGVNTRVSRFTSWIQTNA